MSIRDGESPLVLTGIAEIRSLKCRINRYSETILIKGKIASGIPQFRFPFLDYEDEDEKFTFFEGLTRLWPGIIVVPLVSILSTVSVAKAFSKFFHYVNLKYQV